MIFSCFTSSKIDLNRANQLIKEMPFLNKPPYLEVNEAYEKYIVKIQQNMNIITIDISFRNENKSMRIKTTLPVTLLRGMEPLYSSKNCKYHEVIAIENINRHELSDFIKYIQNKHSANTLVRHELTPYGW